MHDLGFIVFIMRRMDQDEDYNGTIWDEHGIKSAPEGHPFRFKNKHQISSGCDPPLAGLMISSGIILFLGILIIQ